VAGSRGEGWLCDFTIVAGNGGNGWLCDFTIVVDEGWHCDFTAGNMNKDCDCNFSWSSDGWRFFDYFFLHFGKGLFSASQSMECLLPLQFPLSTCPQSLGVLAELWGSHFSFLIGIDNQKIFPNNPVKATHSKKHFTPGTV